MADKAKQTETSDVSADAVGKAAKDGQDAGGNNPTSKEMAKVLEGSDEGYRTADAAGPALGKILDDMKEATDDLPEVDPDAPAKLKQLGDDADIQDAARAFATVLSEQGADAEDDEPAEDVAPEDRPEREHKFDAEDLETPVPLKIRGKVVYKPLEEVINNAQKGIDYTKKTQALAEERKEVGQVREELETLAEDLGANLMAIQTGLWDQLPDAAREAVWTMYQSALQKMNGVRAHALQEQLEAEHDAAKAHFGWEDADDAKDDLERLVSGAVSEFGFEPDELSGISDHRILVVLDAALSHREMEAGASKVKDKLRKTRKKSTVVKPGTRNPGDGSRKSKATKKQRAARKRLSETGGIDDAAAALAGIFSADGA